MKSFNKWVESRWNVPGYYGDSPTITGEYWITESGNVQFADGDVGDQNHESIVIGILGSQISDALGVYDDSEYFDMNYLYDTVVQQKREEYMMPEEDYDDNEVFSKALEEAGVSNEEFSIVGGSGDAREFAVKNWGWKALRGHHVDTWTYTERDRRAIASGIGEILEQEGMYDNFDDYDELNDLEFSINVLANNGWFKATLGEMSGIQQPEKVPNTINQQIDAINTAVRNAGNPTDWIKKPPKPGTGSEKSITMAGDEHPTPWHTIRRKYLNNYGENLVYKNMDNFKNWLAKKEKELDEVGTGTNAIAVFSRPIGHIARKFPDTIMDKLGSCEEEKPKKKKSKKKSK